MLRCEHNGLRFLGGLKAEEWRLNEENKRKTQKEVIRDGRRSKEEKRGFDYYKIKEEE